jgi:hypothetical protein
MDTYETGTFLNLTEGLQIGGGKQIIWAPPYFEADIDTVMGLFGSVDDSPQTEIFTGAAMPQDVLDRASSVLLMPPQDGGTEFITVDGFMGPGKILPILLFQALPVDPFTLSVFFQVEYNTPDGYDVFGSGLQFTEQLQAAAVIGLHHPTGSMFRRWHMVLGGVGYRGGTEAPTLNLGF